MATFKCRRRDVLKLSAAAAVSAFLPACSHSMERLEQEVDTLPVLDAYTPRASCAWIGKDAPDETTWTLFRQATEAATDFSWLSHGDTVFVKLALNSANPYPATTDPWAVACTIRLLKEKGAGRIMVGDSSGVETVHWKRDEQRGSTRECCQQAGLLDVIDMYGAEAVFFEERGYDAFIPYEPQGQHHWNDPVWITSALEEADHIVYLPRVSSHVLGDITSGMKIGVGFLREDSRRIFHSGGENFYAMYEEINQVSAIKDRLRLVISSGRKVLATFGPDNGHVAEPEYGPVIASQDLLAHEMVAYAWLCYNREYETSFFDVGVTGRFHKSRSLINKGFVWYIWDEGGFWSTPGIELYVPGNLYAHPSILNALKRQGGRPTRIELAELNPSEKTLEMAKYVKQKILY